MLIAKTASTRLLSALLSTLWLGLLPLQPSHAAPDEDALGKAQGYPVASTLAQSYEPGYIVGSFSAMDSFLPSCTLAPSTHPLPLGRADTEPAYPYRFAGQTYTLRDYLEHQRVTGLLVLKDGVIQSEHYSYQRRPDQRMTSNSMAKTVVALALGKALQEGLVHSLDEHAATYAPELAGSLYGETRIVNLMRMASGARYVENYSGHDDRARFNALARREGAVPALRSITERAAPEGSTFNYASPQTVALALVVRGATGRSLCDYVDEKIWQPLGAEAKATWLQTPADHIELGQGGFNATVRDYARLGWMLANDGQAQGQEVVPRNYLLDMTDPQRQPEAFRPGKMSYHGQQYFGYGLQVWLLPGSHRRFMLLGVYGQAILVDPELKLVIVHTAAGADAAGDSSGHHLGAERDALFRGIVAQYGSW